MTRDRDFKRLVRARAEATGESYVTARARLRARQGKEHLFLRPRDALAGTRITPEAAAELEARVAADENDALSRAHLLGFYLTRRQSDERARRAEHAMWFVTNSPRSTLTGSPYCQVEREPWYSAGRAVWLALIEEQPDDPALLANAADWLLAKDRQLAISLRERLVELYPQDVDARLSLAHLYTLGVPMSIDTAARALDVLGDPPAAEVEVRVNWLEVAGWMALYAGKHEVAEQYAAALLTTESPTPAWYDGNIVHHGNLVLGHVALQRGDVDAAERHLTAAGKTHGSPQLNSFGPNTSLAAALLRRGRVEAALGFLDDCRLFWAAPERTDAVAERARSALNRWVAVIKSGGVPDFGVNERFH